MLLLEIESLKVICGLLKNFVLQFCESRVPQNIIMLLICGFVPFCRSIRFKMSGFWILLLNFVVDDLWVLFPPTASCVLLQNFCYTFTGRVSSCRSFVCLMFLCKTLLLRIRWYFVLQQNVVVGLWILCPTKHFYRWYVGLVFSRRKYLLQACWSPIVLRIFVIADVLVLCPLADYWYWMQNFVVSKIFLQKCLQCTISKKKHSFLGIKKCCCKP